MEFVLALLGGAAGGSFVPGIAPKFSVSLWKSLVGGVVGGGAIFLLLSKFLTPGGTKLAQTADLGSLVAIMAIGFIGGAVVLAAIGLKHRGNIR